MRGMLGYARCGILVGGFAAVGLYGGLRSEDSRGTDEEDLILRGVVAPLLLAATLDDPDALDSLRRLVRRYDLHAIRGEALASDDERTCTSGPAPLGEPESDPTLIFHFDFASPDTTTGRRHRASFLACSRPSAPPLVRTLEMAISENEPDRRTRERHPVCASPSEFEVLRAFITHPVVQDWLAGKVRDAAIADLRIVTTIPAGAVDGFARCEVPCWVRPDGGKSAGAYVFQVVYDPADGRIEAIAAP